MRKLLFTAILVMSAIAANAVPVKPGVKKTVQLTDGTTVQMTLCGDEHYTFLKDSEGNAYQLNADRRAVRISYNQVAERWAANKQARLSKVQPSEGQKRASRRIGDAGATIGEHRGLVILAQFSDVSFVTPNANQVFNNHFNEVGYTGYGNSASVRDYFLKQSYGQLTIDFDVVGPYTLPNTMEYYGKPYTDEGENLHHDTHPALMAAHAVDAASADVDFRNYDWDGDGVVDQVFIIYAGYAEAQGADENTIWPHEWVLAAEDATRRYNGVTINTYGCTAELAGDGKSWGGDPDGIGTACHEFSHCLGLPDMYDTKGSNYGMGYWDVMCSGSYNDDSHTPAGYTSYERWFSGWMEPTEINTMTRVNNMAPLVEKPEAYILYNEKNKNEYYLLENRQPISFDKGLYGHGLLILHVDYSQTSWQNNSVNTTADHQRMTIIAADNEYGSRSYNSIAGDPWPGIKGNTSLTNYTTPAATLYNANTDGTKLMSKPIDNITENEEAHTVSFVACRPEMDVPQFVQAQELNSNSFTTTWSAVNGAISYEIELTTIDKASSDPSEALQWENKFEKCYSKSASFTDISTKLGDYGLSGWSGSKLFTSPNKLKIGTSTTAGYLRTPSWWGVPSSQELTLVMGAAPFKADVAVNGTITFESVIEGGTSANIVKVDQEFEVSKDGKQVFTFKAPKENNLYRITISPDGQMYLNYLSLYDGTWTAEQLGLNSSAQVSRRASTTTTYSSENNSYTFTDMATNKRYVFRVRALGEENTVSRWSEEGAFEFGSTGVVSVFSTEKDSSSRFFDLQGREVKTPTRGLYIRNGKKFVVK